MTVPLFENVTKSAWVSECGRWRYNLMRTWNPSLPRVCWTLLHPSTADADDDDPTLRRCVAFSQREGFGSLVLVNLFARRCTRPVHLSDPGDPIGPKNPQAILEAVRSSLQVIVGWGAYKLATYPGRRFAYALPLESRYPYCLGTTATGAPRHPLYVRGDAPLVRWAP